MDAVRAVAVRMFEGAHSEHVILRSRAVDEIQTECYNCAFWDSVFIIQGYGKSIQAYCFLAPNFRDAHETESTVPVSSLVSSLRKRCCDSWISSHPFRDQQERSLALANPWILNPESRSRLPRSFKSRLDSRRNVLIKSFNNDQACIKKQVQIVTVSLLFKQKLGKVWLDEKSRVSMRLQNEILDKISSCREKNFSLEISSQLFESGFSNPAQLIARDLQSFH